jgi:uncharacterized protein YjiS (DUF1127 family)
MPPIGSRLVGILNACCLHMDRRTEKRVKNLQTRLRGAIERVEQVRADATRLAADLRNRLHALMLQRRAVERLDRMNDDTQRDSQLHRARSKFAPGQGRNCEAPGCTKPRGAYTSERDNRIYEFCSEACRAAFERPAA